MSARPGIKVCCGGIVGMGETREDRVGFVHALATLPRHPESVPVNALVPVRGTVLGDMLADTPLAKIDDIEFVRTVAVARITMPLSMVRLSAGRESMSEATQALCFMAGANSIFTGDKLLTTGNRGDSADAAMFERLGLRPMTGAEPMRSFPRHPGLEPGSRSLAASVGSGTPGQARGDERVAEAAGVIRIRRPAIFFALGSAVYWELVADLLRATNSVAGHSVAPYWLVLVINVVPAALYAAVALFFCHWLARRVLRQTQKGSDL